MLLGIEIVLLITGIWTLVKGEVPSFVFGSSKYRVEGGGARIFGAILILPLPIAFVGGLVFALLLGEESQGLAAVFEVLTVIVISIVALVVGIMVRKPVEAEGEQAYQETDIEAEITRKVQGSIIYLVLSGLGVTAIAVCPLAFMRTTRALKMIEEHGVGEKYRKTAKIARVAAVAILVFWIGAGTCIAALLLKGGGGL